MLLKISLGLALLASLAALYFAHVNVGGRIDTLTTDLSSEQKAKTAAMEEADASKKAEKATKALAEATAKSLGEATNFLNIAVARAKEQEERANKASTNLTAVTEQMKDAQRDLSAWKTLGLSVDEVRAQREQLGKVTAARDVFSAENKVLARNNRVLDAELKKIKGTEEAEVILPAGTKGTVLAVDPKFDFVVINIGGNQGMVQDGKLLVNRGGKLVAKVKITSVEPNRCIANVLADWKQDEVMEGDQVIY